MINICHVVESSAGGVLSVISDSINILQEHFGNEIQFTILYSERDDTPGDIKDVFRGVTLIKLQMGSRAVEKEDFRTVNKLRKEFKKFDIIHLHSSRAGFLGRIALLTMSKKPACFYSPHAFGFLNQDFSKHKRAFIWITEFILAKLSGARYIACGDSEYNIALRISKNTYLVENGIPPLRFKTKSKHEDRGFYVASSGRNALQKDPCYFTRIANQNKNPRVKFLWVGKINGGEKVLSTGWVDRLRVYDYISECDIFLSTSLWEGLPVIGIEAMMLGKPLLVRDTSSFIDLVQHEVNGFIFSTVSEANYYIDKLSQSPELVNEMGLSSRKIALENFTANNFLKLMDLYSSSLKNR